MIKINECTTKIIGGTLSLLIIPSVLLSTIYITELHLYAFVENFCNINFEILIPFVNFAAIKYCLIKAQNIQTEK